nr:immunoglobulin heavy chain junction region [Macaca mulatta]MOW77093.1 immunoglobulin heavy chain junction region [Macaca mulatta]MOW77418.1 immunoglobulin heavy chain junction region [Macaca mulatta]MOW77660.1 immunoglobulin heavy chain junction region [Macaca mulatta]MOW77693.1 immunoglobulin heavy chain junction region [Macaca mulatta]
CARAYTFWTGPLDFW